MRPTAFLINVARAEIVAEMALHRALSRGNMAGGSGCLVAIPNDHWRTPALRAAVL